MNPVKDHGFHRRKWKMAKAPENRKRGRLDPRSKLDEIQSTIGTHKTVIYYPMMDWKKQKKT